MVQSTWRPTPWSGCTKSIELLIAIDLHQFLADCRLDRLSQLQSTQTNDSTLTKATDWLDSRSAVFAIYDRPHSPFPWCSLNPVRAVLSNGPRAPKQPMRYFFISWNNRNWLIFHWLNNTGVTHQVSDFIVDKHLQKHSWNTTTTFQKLSMSYSDRSPAPAGLTV